MSSSYHCFPGRPGLPYLIVDVVERHGIVTVLLTLEADGFYGLTDFLPCRLLTRIERYE